MKFSELKEKSADDLQQELIASRREQLNLRMQKATRQLTQTHNLRNVRRKIAQIKTIQGTKTGQAS